MKMQVKKQNSLGRLSCKSTERKKILDNISAQEHFGHIPLPQVHGVCFMVIFHQACQSLNKHQTHLLPHFASNISLRKPSFCTQEIELKTHLLQLSLPVMAKSIFRIHPSSANDYLIVYWETFQLLGCKKVFKNSRANSSRSL